MPACRYVEDISSAAMLATNRSAGVTPEMNLSERVTCSLCQTQVRLPTLETSPEVQLRGVSGPNVLHKKNISLLRQVGEATS